MAYRKKKKSPLKTLSRLLFSVSATLSRLFDNSLTAHVTKAVCHIAATLSIRVLGIFFVSFGAYSFLFSLLLDLFTQREVFASSLYGGIIMALGCIPLMFSRGNVSTSLLKTATGRILCRYLAINKNSLHTDDHSGRMSYAFLLGLAAGSVCAIFPLSSVLTVIFLVLIVGIILAIPETGMFFMTLLIFTAEISMLYTVTAAVICSYALKLLRRKRKLCFKKADLIPLIFFVYTALSVLMTVGTAPSASSFRFCIYLIPYFLCLSLLRERERIVKTINTAVYALGFVCVLYVLGYLADLLIPVAAVADRGYLLRVVLELPIIQSGVLPFACASIAPVCMAFTLRPYGDGPRMAYCTLLVAMIATLIISGMLEFALATIAICVLYLLATGSRRIYFFLAVGLCGATALTYTETLFGRIYRFALRHLTNTFNTVRDLSSDMGIALPKNYLICGQGYAADSAASGNFYVSLLSILGIVGFVILFSFIIIVVSEAAVILLKAYRRKADATPDRFKGVASTNEIHIYAAGLVFSIASSLVCAVFYNLHASDTAYIMLFLGCGICTAYSRSVRSELERTEGCANCNSSSDRASTIV